MAARKKAVKTSVKRKGRLTVDDVRELALALPATEERPSYGTPGFRVSDKLFARVLDEDSIVIKVDFDHREALLQSQPDVFRVTPHYQDWPMVIVQLATVKRPLLQSLLKEAWRRCASAKVLKAQEAGSKDVAPAPRAKKAPARKRSPAKKA
ncbi:MmcQ/YjbR family DNA-binding protein [Corallococcus sp. BB11-1]|uniref:MmcQ/YjbR family DNA-binding protein n=1 Tax=Corallococcus sp. BB11-1 TaxID=2996783 RepID=UPI0022706542|nr:MmcQ/YjbR family DNA-binding protein [Corallococcus sp. BB11-1]MCY1032228.1 MmcQ/YjbR family DNA-binding protein [Corallococcus sp. BB11-1]